jgi:hypothetical protein
MNHIDLFENFINPQRKEFTESEIQYYQRLWDSLNQKYRWNTFFVKLWGQAKEKRYLTNKQWIQLEYLLKNGRSQYDAGILPNNY